MNMKALKKFGDNAVLKLRKALYGLQQAPRAWYDSLTTLSNELGSHQTRMKTVFFQTLYGKCVRYYYNLC